MGSLNFVKDGIIKLPPGFRFQPTDEELVFQYLLRKTFSCPLPASIIPEINVSKHNPWDLPGDEEQDRYFFSYKEAKYPNGDRTNRATEGGYWKATGVDKQIASSKRKPLVGLRKTLVFYGGKPWPQRGSTRTDWIMHEYRIILTGKAAAAAASSCSQIITTKSRHDQNCSIQLGNWVLCHIFMKKGSPRTVREIAQDTKNYAVFTDHRETAVKFSLMYNSSETGSSSTSSSSSDSSVLTSDEVCSSSSYDDDTTH